MTEGRLQVVMEHRWGQRSKVGVEVRLYASGWRAPRFGNLWDVSVSGALIETESSLRPLQCIEVEIALRRSTGAERMCIPACVVRKADRGVGVEWCESLPIPVDLLVTRAIDVIGQFETQGGCRTKRAVVPGPTPAALPSSVSRWSSNR
jgi:PilZ domain